ncbi:MAG TPA: SRPBCC family protein [Gemmatimonadales bacterium]|nr:SRPBCC family protein [Gemmatimonadales bacterium]
MIYRLHRRQVVGGDLADVFGFFRSPLNLEAMTPPWLGFRVLHASDREVREGTRIAYRLRLHELPFRWESRIAEYSENAMFADEQLVGPYRHWYHRHLFTPVPGGVAIEDVVEYRMPFGPLGRFAHAAFVCRQLGRIFDYRARVIGARFPFLQAAREGQKVLS